jgi:hypothetical protein
VSTARLGFKKETSLSRALNINATHDHVTATCGKRNIRITAIETLASGGTRLVTSNSVDSAAIAKAYGSNVIVGTVRRMPTRINHL